MLKKLSNLIRKIEYRMSPVAASGSSNISYSQCGEDLIIDYIFKLRNISHPSYIDIGAHDPFYLSNTAIFYRRKCKGINIEANPVLIEKFNRYRPKDVNLNVGVSSEKGVMDFYVMKDSTLSTFSKEEAESLKSHGKELASIHPVKLTTIPQILSDYTNNVFPDLLSIDVEGLDFQIIRQIDFQASSPKVICVEAAEYSPVGAGKRKDELLDYIISQGYYEYANTNLNAIFVRNDFWFIS